MKSCHTMTWMVCILVTICLTVLGIWRVIPESSPKDEYINSESVKMDLTKSNISFNNERVAIGERFAEETPFFARFPFQNKGDVNVELLIKTCCGSHATFKDNKIQYGPGENGEVTIEITGVSPKEQGHITRTATVLQKGRDTPITELEASVLLKRHWRIRPFELRYGKIYPHDIVTTELVIEAGTDEEQGIISGYTVDSSLLEIKGISNEILNQRRVYKYQVSLAGNKISGNFNTDIIFQTTNLKVPEVVVPVTAEFPGIIKAIPQSLYFGQVLPETVVKKGLCVISNTSDPIQVTSVFSKPEYVSPVDAPSSTEASQVKLDFILKVPSNAQGVLRGNVTILCKASEECELNIPWLAVVSQAD